MGDSDFADRFVVLQHGVIVPAAPYVLILALEARGFTVSRDGDTLVVEPPDRLTDEDCGVIRQWKHHLLLLLDYCARTGLDAHLFRDAPATPSPRSVAMRTSERIVAGTHVPHSSRRRPLSSPGPALSINSTLTRASLRDISSAPNSYGW